MTIFNTLFGKKPDNSTKDRSVREPETVYSPMNGQAIPLNQVEDPVFAEGIMGPGIGIRPEEGKLYSPADGEIAAIFSTGHAVGIKTKGGMELLLHIGIDTVSMNGDGFHTMVSQGQHVSAGQLLVEFDMEKIRKSGLKDTTMVLVSNAAQLGTMTEPSLGEIHAGDKLFIL